MPVGRLRATGRSSTEEVEAVSLASGYWSHTGARTSSYETLQADEHDAVRLAISEQGATLPDSIRLPAERRMGADFSQVSIHTGVRASSSARTLRAAAYTVGPHIVFGAGRYAESTEPGRRLLTHELAHVAQQAKSGQPVVARQPEDDPDAKLSLGVLDDSLVTAAAEELVGETAWTIAREFLRGLWGGLRSAGPDQLDRINKKFSDFGFRSAGKFAGGYVVGVITGLLKALWGLVEAIWTLVTLPYKVGNFVFTQLPQLAAKYAPRLEQLVGEGGAIRTLIADLVADPKDLIEQLQGFAALVKDMALGKVRAMGRTAAKDILAFLEESWYEFGRDIGKVIGQVLFEIILALASDAIGNAVKAAAEIAGRVTAKVAEGVLSLVRGVGRLLGQAFEWAQGIGRRLAGKAGEIFEKFKTLISKLRNLFAELLEEGAVADTGVGGIKAPVPSSKGAGALESRALPPPRTSPAKVGDLTPPKVHPSNLPKEPARAPVEVKRIPEGVSGTKPPTPTRVQPSTVTAKPTGGVAKTKFNESALADVGMSARNALKTFEEQHHLLVQQHRKWFASKGINIDEYSVTLTWGEHSAVHSTGWNRAWSTWIDANRNAQPRTILAKMNAMRKQFGLENNPIQVYVP